MVTGSDLRRLLPALHRLRDAELAARGGAGDGPLSELLDVLADQADVVDADLDRMADAWFIETCADWLVPYLGDLLAATPLHPIGPGATQPRAAVANTLAYRQRKGTLAVVEDLARDVTGWPTRAVEAFTLLRWTQAVNHVRPERTVTPDLHSPELAGRLGGPFDRAARTVEVRSPRLGGRYGVDVVVLHTYRLQPQTTELAEAVPAGTGRWHLDPFGLDVPLAQRPAPAGGIGLAGERELPLPVPRSGGPEPQGWELQGRSVSGWRPLTPVVRCDLSDWRPPPAGADAAVDPVLGRVTVTDATLQALRATTTTLAPMPLGGGAYDRRDRPAVEGWQPPARRVLVGRDLPPDVGVFPSLAGALMAWSDDGPPGRTDVVVVDNAVYDEPLPAGGLVLRGDQELHLICAGTVPPDAGQEPDPAAPLDRRERRAVLAGPLEVRGDSSDGPVGLLVVDGLWITGELTVGAGNLAGVVLQDCTVAPREAGPAVRVDEPSGADDDNVDLTVSLVRCVVGGVHLAGSRGSLHLDTVLVHGEVRAELGDVTVLDSTVTGGVACQALPRADNSLFLAPLAVTRSQDGCLRYCFVPEGSRTPRRHRCQPDMALAAQRDVADSAPPPDPGAVRARVEPSFTSLAFRHPASAQLAQRCAPEISEGAEDGAEMGVYRSLRQPQRRENLAVSLDEYLPVGLRAALLFAS